MRQLTEKEAIDFFAEFYHGEHHIPGFKPKVYGYGWSVNHDRGDLATYDYNQLTRLVLMAHDKSIRVGIQAARNNIIKISIHGRDSEAKEIYNRHPTIEQAIEKFRQPSISPI